MRNAVHLVSVGSILVVVLVGSIVVIAQRSLHEPAAERASEPAPVRTPEQVRASHEAHQRDFDYLLGDWQFTADSREYGPGRGYWSAVRLDDGQILDEYRIVNDRGETIYVTTTLRAYNVVLDRWELISTNAGHGLQDVGTARRIGDEMHVEQDFGALTDTPSTWRIRYYAIGPDSFSWAGDRSTDGGKTWEKNHLRIAAHRIGPARYLGPIAVGRSLE